jgi:hypothetical protein
MTSMYQLYRQFNKGGQLLYVGMSLHTIARLSGHKKSGWFAEIARVEVENFDSKDCVVAAEAKAIKTENPRYNIVHSSRRALPKPSKPRVPKYGSSNTQRQAKWRTRNTELNRQRAREGMRKRRAAAKEP